MAGKQPAPAVSLSTAAQAFLAKMAKKSGLIKGADGTLRPRPGSGGIRRVHSR